MLKLNRFLSGVVSMILFATTPITVTASDASSRPQVLTFKLSMSNMHAIRGKRTILVDAGSKKDMPQLESELKKAGIAWTDIAAVIVTHGHSDHAALASDIRERSGAVVVMGRGDLDMAATGRNDDLKPTNLMASFLKQFAIDPTYPAFKPDQFVEQEMRLDSWGIAGRVFQMPGHTPGSLVIALDDGRTFVGDMILGGYLGGALMPEHAGEHYFHADRDRNLTNIRTLLQGSSQTFYLGHGGPVSRKSVEQAFGR